MFERSCPSEASSLSNGNSFYVDWRSYVLFYNRMNLFYITNDLILFFIFASNLVRLPDNIRAHGFQYAKPHSYNRIPNFTLVLSLLALVNSSSYSSFL